MYKKLNCLIRILLVLCSEYFASMCTIHTHGNDSLLNFLKNFSDKVTSSIIIIIINLLK